jgi:hypothetical protein
MNDVTRQTGLQWWAGPGQDMGTAYEAVRASPRVGDAVRALVGGMLELAESDPALLAIFKDAGRYSAAMWAFYLHETSGLTLPALRDLCARSGLQSPGRVRALLQFLHHLRYVEPIPTAGRGLAYAMTPTFMTAWRAQLRAALSAAVLIEPEVAHLLSARDAGVLRAFGRIHAEGYLAISDPSVVPRVFHVFLHAYAGSQILWTLLCSSRDGRFPPVQAGPVSIAGLARRFDIARVQVKRVLDAAAIEGLVSQDAGGLICFSAEAQQEVELLYVIQLVQILCAAGAAAQTSGLLHRRP